MHLNFTSSGDCQKNPIANERGWPFLPFNKLGESSKINGFIGSWVYTVKGMSHSSNLGFLQMEAKYITDNILIKLGYK